MISRALCNIPHSHERVTALWSRQLVQVIFSVFKVTRAVTANIVRFELRLYVTLDRFVRIGRLLLYLSVMPHIMPFPIHALATRNNKQQTRAMITPFAKARGNVSDKQINDIYTRTANVRPLLFMFFPLAARAGSRVITQVVWMCPKGP